MKNRAQTEHIDDPARLVLSLQVVGFYFLTVACVIGAIIHYDMPLYKGEGYRWPTAVMFVVWFLYYVAPLILAVIFGFLFRPFGKSFRNIFFAIFLIEICYSFVVGMLRWEYLQNFKNTKQWKKSDRIRIAKVTPSYFDRNQDGFIEEIRLNVDFNFAWIRPGQYQLQANIFPPALVASFGLKGGGKFEIAKLTAESILTKEFILTARHDRQGGAEQVVDFQVAFSLSRIVAIDQYGKRVLTYARWAPFLRTTDWQGIDKEIHGDVLVIDQRILPDVFSMRAVIASQRD